MKTKLNCSAFLSNKRLVRPAISLIDDCKFDMSAEHNDPEVLLSRDGLPLCTRGNFSTITGPEGARKTFLCTAMAGAFLSNAFSGLEHSNGDGGVLWCDTEQASGHVWRIGKRLHRIAGVPTDRNYDKLTILALRGKGYAEAKRVVFAAIETLRPDFCVIDGLADLCSSPNEESECQQLIADVLRVTKDFNMHILCVIHTNPAQRGATPKMRGHLGSEARRKAETVILCKPTKIGNTDATSCEFTKTRDIRPADFAFSIDETGLPKEEETANIKAVVCDKVRNTFEKIFTDMLSPSLPNAELVKRVMEISNIKDSAAKKRISKGLEQGYLTKTNEGLYNLTENIANQFNGFDNDPYEDL